MKQFRSFFLVVLGLTLHAGISRAQTTPASATAIAYVGDDSNYNFFAGFVRADNLAPALKAAGTYTIFAPHNIIFRNMPFNKLDSLSSDTSRMAALVKAHTVKGKFTRLDINKKLTLGKGKTVLTNLLGQPLTLTITADSHVVITDKNGNSVNVTQLDAGSDLKSVVHGVDNLLLKNK